MRAFISTAMPENPVNLLFLLLFVSLFTGVAWYNTRPSRKAAHERESRLPFND